MKIALFPSAFHPNLGGVEELTRQLAHALVRRGHRIIVVSQRWPRDLPAYEEFEGLPLHRVAFARAPQGFGLRDLRARANWRRRRAQAERETARIVADMGADLTHIQCAGPNAFYALGAARALKLPLILSAQGELTMDATGLYKSAWMREVLREITRDAARVTACSQDALNDVEAFADASLTGRARVIYNGISLADFASITDAHAHSRPYVFAMGRFVAQKGFDVLLEAWKRADLPAFDLIIAGDGPERGALRELARDMPNVHFWGTRRTRRCGALAARLRVVRFALARRAAGHRQPRSDGGGARGRRFAHRRRARNRDRWRNRVLVPPADAGALADALREMASQPRRRAALGAAGFKRAQMFDWDELAAQYEAVYREALGL